MKKIKIMLVLLVTIMSLLAFTSCNKKDIVFMLEESNVELTVGATYTPKLIIENVENDQLFATQFMEENPDYYIPADVDETFSKKHIEEVYFSKLKMPLTSVFNRHLMDPIYFEAEAKKKE